MTDADLGRLLHGGGWRVMSFTEQQGAEFRKALAGAGCVIVPKLAEAADLETEFTPCVIVFDDPKRTEMVLRDCPTVWTHVEDNPNLDLGYDMETGELVAVRIYGDVAQSK